MAVWGQFLSARISAVHRAGLTVRSREHFFTFRPPPRAPSDHVTSRLHGKKGKRKWSRTLFLANREQPQMKQFNILRTARQTSRTTSPELSTSIFYPVLDIFTPNIQIEALEISWRKKVRKSKEYFIELSWKLFWCSNLMLDLKEEEEFCFNF